METPPEHSNKDVTLVIDDIKKEVMTEVITEELNTNKKEGPIPEIDKPIAIVSVTSNTEASDVKEPYEFKRESRELRELRESKGPPLPRLEMSPPVLMSLSSVGDTMHKPQNIFEDLDVIQTSFDISIKKNSPITLKESKRIFYNALNVLKEFCNDTKRKIALKNPFMWCTILTTNGDIYDFRHGDIFIAAIKLSNDKAYTSLAFSNNNVGVLSGKLISTGFSSDTMESYFNYTSCSGGVPIFKNGVLVGSIGVTCEIQSLNEEIASLTIKNTDYEISPKLQNNAGNNKNEKMKIVYISKTRGLIEREKKFIIVELASMTNICSHRYLSINHYFTERGKSTMPLAVCPMCVSSLIIN